jgi:hypothetical protein
MEVLRIRMLRHPGKQLSTVETKKVMKKRQPQKSLLKYSPIKDHKAHSQEAMTVS